MDWRRRYTVALAMVLAVAAIGIATLTGAAPVPPIDKLGAYTPTKQPNAAPLSEGPALVDAVYWPGTGPSNAVLWLVFDKDVPNPGDFQSDDLVFYRSGVADTLFSGLAFAYHQANGVAPTTGKYMNVLAVTGFPATGFAALNPATDEVALRNPRRIPPAGANDYKDATPIPVKTGPAVTRVEVEAGGAAAGLADNTGDVLRVYFTHMITSGTVATGGNARNAFTFPELGIAGANPTITWAANDRFVDINFTDNLSQLKIRSAITKVRVYGNAVFTGIRDTAAGQDTPAQPNMNPRWAFTDNLGPHLLRAGYSSNLDRLTLVFDDDIQAGILDPLDTGAFTISGGVTYGAISSDDGDNVLVLSGLSASPVDSTVTIADPTKVLDYQNNQGVPGSGVTVAASPIIVLANYHDGGATLGLDFITLWFDVPLTAAPDSTNFASYGFDVSNQHVSWSPTSPATANIGNTNAPHWTWSQGVRLYLTETPLSTGDGVNNSPSPSYAWVRDATGPDAANIVGDMSEVASDTLFQHLHTTNQEDRAYALLFTRRNLDIQDSYVQNNLINGRYTPLALPNPGEPNADLVGVFPVGPGDTDTQGDTLAIGNSLYVAAITIDAEGNVSGVQSVGQIIVGLAAPRDTLAGIDDDMIHIFGLDHPEGDPGIHFACGDSGSAPPNADSVRVYADAGRTILLGSGLVDHSSLDVEGSFGPIELDPSNTSYDLLYFVSVQLNGTVVQESAQQTPILNDNLKPTFLGATDPLNAQMIYSGGDTLRVLAQLADPTAATALPSLSNANAINNLLYTYADLSEYVTTAGGDSVLVTSLGANQVDDDHDWVDVAQAGAGSFASFTANGVMDFPEPYVDENGDGVYTPGETFVDLDLPGYHLHLYDAGDQNLDANDPDEAGWYYFQYQLQTADLVADPHGLTNFAVLNDVPAILHIEDNAVRSNATDNSTFGDNTTFTAYMDAISGGNGGSFLSPLGDHCPSYSLEHLVVNDDGFLGTEDSQAPTVSEISFLERATDWTSGNSGNIIEAGDHVYKLAAGDVGSFFNLADSTLSDDDVIFVGLQIAADTNDLDTYQWLTLDPPGDANGDGMPGIAEYDDDNDGGIDTLDVQVAAAMDTTLRQADMTDNDGDAFFRLNPLTGQYIWFNVDESTSNGIDDDGDGVVDNAEEVENYTYANDDDEDGIMDGSAVRIDGVTGRVVSNPAYDHIFVKGFNDPDNIANYDRTVGGTRPNNGKSPVSFGPLATNDAVPGKPDVFGSSTAGADNFAMQILALGGPNVISAQHQLNTDGLSPWVPVDRADTSFAFNYFDQNGRNLNMKVLKSLYNLADGTEYRLRAVAYDWAYQGNANWAVPLRFEIDSTGPIVSIPPPPFDDVVDKDGDPTNGTQVCDVDTNGEPKHYTLESDLVSGNVNDIDHVDFQMWDGAAWTTIGTDYSSPYNLDWTYGASIGNNPPAAQDTVYFRSIATDKFGNIEPQAQCDSLFIAPDVPDTSCYELQLIITDCTPPWSCLCQIGSDYNPMDGVFVPVESAVDLSACFSDGDGDSTTNDVVRIEFQIRPVGSDTWELIPSLTGVPTDTSGDGIPDVLVDVTGVKHPIITTGPDTLVATVTWDTHNLPAGSYDLRAVAYDIEGNQNANMTCVATATVDSVALRAYIQPCVDGEGPNTEDLFANVYIHDTAVKKVEFQYTADIDGDGKPLPGATWTTINIQGDQAEERKGDVVLRAGTAHVEELTGAIYGDLSGYRFYDVDGDGYNPVDPIYQTAAATFSGQTPVAGFEAGGIIPPTGADLTAFAPHEYYADIADDGLDAADWIMLDNRLNGSGDNQIDLWTTSWDVSGLNGCYAIRAVATDEFGNTDHDGLGGPDDVIWTEECCFDANAPQFCVTGYIPADGSAMVPITYGPECPYVGPQDFLTFVATPVPGSDTSDIAYVKFWYSTDGGYNWTSFAEDHIGPDYTGVFPYGDIPFVTDTQTNFRAVAYDSNGNFDSEPNACKACLVLGENQGPETDVVYIVTAEGDTLDANTVLRGTANPYCLEPTTLYMLVTAEDNQTIDHVEIWYKKVSGDSPSDTTDWAAVPASLINPAPDTAYPYEFTWDISSLTDGVYAFFPRGVDVNGNETPIFKNPFWFGMNSRLAHITSASKNGVEVTSLTPGEEVVLRAELDDPTDNVGVTVHFSYAERVEGEMLSVSSSYPYTATTDETIWAHGATGEHGSETVWVNGTQATWYSNADFAALPAGDKMAYTITGPTTVQFGGAMAADDTVKIDYDITDCMPIATGDSVAPYSVAWDADSGGLVPVPTHAATTHYDLMASASRSFNGAETCAEDCVSEGFALPIQDTSAPIFSVWGLDYRNDDQPGNPLCASVGGNDLVGDVGSTKSKLSGIEEQFYVTPVQRIGKGQTPGVTDAAVAYDDGSDWASVTMRIGQNAPIDFAKVTGDITVPITFYIDDLANVTANGWSGKAVNPDSVENVTISMPGIGATNATMYDDGTNGDAVAGDGVYTYMATLPLGATYAYTFSVDYHGDDQLTNIADPRNPGSNVAVPDELWFYSTTDPGSLFGVNTLNEVTVTVTDNEGNASTNLMTGNEFGGALGQIWVTYDPTPEPVKSIWFSKTTVAPNSEVQVNVEAPDTGTPTADVIKLTGVIVQVSMDDLGTRWRTIYSDYVNQDSGPLFLNYDGGWGGTFNLPSWMNPLTDGIDNNRDGVTDDAAEAVYTYQVRAVTVDDCYNTGYSCGHPRVQATPVCGEITVDAAVPQACLTWPQDGYIVALGDTINLSATSSDTDIDYVQFEYSLNGGADWNTIDCTPLNSDDPTWDADGSDGWNCTWNTQFLAGELGSDFYVTLRARAVDKAGNDQGNDPDLVCSRNIIVNDQTGPLSAITRFYSDCFPEDPVFEEHFKKPFDPTLALSHTITVWGRATGWNSKDVSTVVVQMAPDNGGTPGAWTTIGVDNSLITGPAPIQAIWSVEWDTDPVAEGTYWLRSYATDADGNVQGDTSDPRDGTPDELPAVKVVVDHTAPDFMLTMVGPETLTGQNGDQDMPADPPVIRADMAEQETGICPQLSRQITFMASATDVAGDTEAIDSMGLEFYDDVTNPENGVWRSLSGDLGWFDYRDASGTQNPDGTWRLTVDSVDELLSAMEDAAGSDLPSKVYRFRVRATDYACNTDEASPGTWLRLDAWDPEPLWIYAGGREFEAGSGAEGNTVHVAGGDVVPLAAKINDGLWFSYPSGEWPDNQDIKNQSSDHLVVQFSYRVGEGDSHVIGLGTLDDNGTPDGADDLWKIDWATPTNLPGSTDSLYTIEVAVRDFAGNCGSNDAEDVVAVQDVTPPDDTQMEAVMSADECSTYPLTPIVFGESEVDGYGIDETVLAQSPNGAKTVGVVAREVELYAATPQGDASMDGGRVIFEGQRVSGTGTPSTDGWIPIGDGECEYRCPDGLVFQPKPGVTGAASHQGPVWGVSWDTKALGTDGQPVWYDPTVDGTEVWIRARAVDAWGNAESGAIAYYRVQVDNTAPAMTSVLVNGAASSGVERNSKDGVLIEAKGGSTTDFVDNDLTVTFYYKLHTDLNADGSWIQLPGTAGIAPTNDNPDHTRPYAFLWDTNGYRDADGKPLSPGMTYDVSVAVSDLVCNTTSVVAHSDLDGGHAELTVNDTMPPIATIVGVDRDLSGAACSTEEASFVENPDTLRINGVNEVWARILDGSTDTQDVKFWYRQVLPTTGAWEMADADVDMKNLNDIQTWVLYNWNTAGLISGATYQLVAEAKDDAGNFMNHTTNTLPAIYIVVDRMGPTFTAVEPVANNVIVPENVAGEGTVCDPDQRVADLIATTPDKDVDYKNSWNNCVSWEWKYSADEDVDSNWHSFDAMTMYDAGTGRYTATADLLDLFGYNAYLVDWRIVASDVAGNTEKSIVASRTIVDNVDPDLEITNFARVASSDTSNDTSINPIDNNQITDVSAGDQIVVYATADDDEPNVPGTGVNDSTGVAEVQFFVRPAVVDKGVGAAASDSYDSWQFLGTAGYDAQRGLWWIRWNTSGLSEGNYEVKAQATDDAANCGDSHNIVTVTVTNVASPLAQVAGFNPHLLGAVSKATLDRVYGLTFGQKEAASVFFQYREAGIADEPWTTIGTSTFTGVTLDMVTRGEWLMPQDLWYAEFVTSNLDTEKQYELRAVATDQAPAKPGDATLMGLVPGQGGIKPLAADAGVFGGLYDLDNTPTLTVQPMKDTFGGTYLMPVDMQLGYLTANPMVYVTGNPWKTGRVEVHTGFGWVAPFVVLVGEDGSGNIAEAIPEMDPKADDAQTWVGQLYDKHDDFQSLDPTRGAVLTVYASASKQRAAVDTHAPYTDMKSTPILIHQVTPNRGSNGVAGVNGNGTNDPFAVEVPAGAFGDDYGLLIKPTDMPTTPAWQDKYFDTIGQAYRTSLLQSDWDADAAYTHSGYEATVWVRVPSTLLHRTDGSAIDPSKLTVRRWDGHAWSGDDISHVLVTPEASDGDTSYVITLKTKKVSSVIWAVVATDKTAPVEISASPAWSGYTDQDPILRGVIRSPGDGIDTGSFEFYLDGKLAYSSYEDWFLYPGSEFDWEYATEDDQTVGWEYRHTCSNNDALKEGPHTAKIVFKDDQGNTFGDDYTFDFNVDRTAPYIEFHGGFVGSPKLDFAAGYTNLDQNILTVKMYDGGSGLLFREDRIDDFTSNDWNYCEQENAEELCEQYGSAGMDCDEILPGDGGFKYDVWVIDDCQTCGSGSQSDIDNMEERTLLYTGTADALAPYITPPLSTYEPGDTLSVPLAVLTGGHRIHDGSVLEIVLYSDRLIMQGGEPTLSADMQAALDAMQVFGPVKFDAAGQEYVVYTRGPMDNVFNAGSRFVEQRFLVDMSAPTVVPSSPGVVCGGGEPGTPVTQSTSYTFTASFQDAGSGVQTDPAPVVKVTGPNGSSITPEDLNIDESGISFKITNGGNLLTTGTYTVTISGQDKLGNKFSSTCSFQVGGNVVQVLGAKVVPNPFNPMTGVDAQIMFNLNKPADVEVTAYDWAGDYVATIFRGTKGIGPVSIAWGGQTEDGRDLANGVYLIRIVVNDGSRQEPRVLKLAIWNEK
jgi:hypothetical protein